MKKYNQYFNIFKTTLDTPGELITTIRVRHNEKIWEKINNEYLDTEKWKTTSIFNLDIKSYIQNIFPDIYNLIKELTLHDNRINLDDDCFSVCLGTLSDYRKVNEQFDNEISFLEYINSEITEMDKYCYITEDILKEAGFEYLKNGSNIGREVNKLNPEIYSQNYKEFRKWTNDTPSPIKLDINNGQNNRGTSWHLHIDNSDCETIGCADINTVWEFNTLMQVFKSKFRL